MADVITLTPRKIQKEDINLTTTTGSTRSATVLGAGSVTVTDLDAILIGDLTLAANDTAAATAGVNLGCLYRTGTTLATVRARLV